MAGLASMFLQFHRIMRTTKIPALLHRPVDAEDVLHALLLLLLLLLPPQKRRTPQKTRSPPRHLQGPMLQAQVKVVISMTMKNPPAPKPIKATPSMIVANEVAVEV